MSENDWAEILNDFKEEIASIGGIAERCAIKFEKIRRQAESFEVALLNHRLEEQRRSVSRIRGYASIMRDRKWLGASLSAAALGLVVVGAITKDGLAAINGGLSSFDTTLRGLGETAWVVSLGKDLTVPARDTITPGKTWVTWESLKSALAQLEGEASQGVGLGTLDSIISRL